MKCENIYCGIRLRISLECEEGSEFAKVCLTRKKYIAEFCPTESEYNETKYPDGTTETEG